MRDTVGPLTVGALALMLTLRCAAAACPPASAIADHVFGGGLCLAATTFGAENAGAAPILIVVVHGDISDGGAATYHVEFARSLVRPGVVVVALIRPGYADAAGRQSEGSTLGRWDNYTAANVAAVAGAIDSLKTHYRPPPHDLCGPFRRGGDWRRAARAAPRPR